jgi:hypothetical protein
LFCFYCFYCFTHRPKDWTLISPTKRPAPSEKESPLKVRQSKSNNKTKATIKGRAAIKRKKSPLGAITKGSLLGAGDRT